MSYSKDEKKIKREVLYFTSYCLQVADMITPENKNELVQSIQKQSNTLARKVRQNFST